MQKDLKGFLTTLANRKEYRHVIAKPVDESNLVAVSGDVVGKKRMKALVEIGRQHGLLVLSDQISIWDSEEYFERYGQGRG